MLLIATQAGAHTYTISRTGVTTKNLWGVATYCFIFEVWKVQGWSNLILLYAFDEGMRGLASRRTHPSDHRQPGQTWPCWGLAGLDRAKPSQEPTFGTDAGVVTTPITRIAPSKSGAITAWSVLIQMGSFCSSARSACSYVIATWPLQNQGFGGPASISMYELQWGIWHEFVDKQKLFPLKMRNRHKGTWLYVNAQKYKWFWIIFC